MDNQKLSSEEDQQDKLAQKKPRRKDTPVLNCPPLIPGKIWISHTISISQPISQASQLFAIVFHRREIDENRSSDDSSGGGREGDEEVDAFRS